MKALKDQLSDMGDGPSSIYVLPALGKKGGPVVSSRSYTLPFLLAVCCSYNIPSHPRATPRDQMLWK